jgi:hypothetical protein
MSQSEFALIGEALAAGINDGIDGVSTAAHRRKTAAELGALTEDGWRVDVIQKFHQTAPADRSSRFHRYAFDIVFRRRFDRQADEDAAIDPLCEVVELAEDWLYGLPIAVNANDVECLETRREPPFDPESLGRGVFLSVITGVWEVVR